MRQASYTAQELADMALPCLPKTRQGVARQAKREEWTRTHDTVRGGPQYQYLSGLLPDEVKTAITMHELKRDGNLALAVASQLPSLRRPSTPLGEHLTETQIKNALAKADLVRLYDQWVTAAAWGKKDQARADFLLAYEGGAWPLLEELLGPLSWKTVERWKTTLKNHGDALLLAEKRGIAKRGKTVVTPEQAKVLLACVLHPNRPRISEAIRMACAVMRARQIASAHVESTYRRWVEGWKSKNHHIYTFHREGAKAWNDKCAYYIERDYSLINVGDIVVADGHVLNFEVVNPWTGKPKRMTLIAWIDMKSNYPLGWEIMPTEDTAAISSALRRAILRLGRYPQVAYLDNGRAFRARFFEGCANFEESGLSGLYERLGMKTIHAWPYHGQSKVVERFFGTLAELERWCPTYTGTSIERKPPRLNRGEKLHRKVWDKAFGDYVLTIEQAHGAIAAWFDDYAQRPQSGHLQGKSPQEVFEAEKGPGVDPVELRYLMMSQEIKTIHRNGVTLRGRNYYTPALYGRRHPVVVRYDLQDQEAVYVFEPDGVFLGEARQVEGVHPAAAILGTEEDRDKLVRHIEHKRHQEKEASSSARAFLEEEILPAHQRQLAAIGILPLDSDGEPFGCAQGPRSRTAANPGPGARRLPAPAQAMSNAECERAMAEAEAAIAGQAEFEAGQIRQRLALLAEPERYEELLEMQVRGVTLCREWQAFVNYFETTRYYAGRADYYDDLRARVAIMYQMEG